MSKLTKTILILAGIVIVYSILCRVLGIYFFWESKVIGLIILLIGSTSYLFDIYKTRKSRKRKTIWIKIGIAICVFGLLLMPVTWTEMRNSAPYAAAVDYLRKDPKIREQVGSIKGFGLFPLGSMTITTINGVVSGDATLHITVKGEKKYKELTLTLRKSPKTDWEVNYIE